MAEHRSGRLKPLTLSRIKEPGLYPDGLGLYLRVTAAGTRHWIFRYRMNGRTTPRDFGLGPLHTVSLARARELATEARLAILAGKDPIDEKRAVRASSRAERARALTFREAAERYIATHSPAWRNPKHIEQWSNTLATYAYPILGPVLVQDVDTSLIVKVLEPIWSTRTETASRLRGRIQSVLDWAEARGHRTGDNPARWRGKLENLLPPRSKIQRVQHHAALPYTEIGAFMTVLRKQPGTAAIALQFLILTAARTSEVTGATWDEIDLKAKTWTIPAGRIKAGREHRVPLADAALALLQLTPEAQRTGIVFPGEGRKSASLSSNAFLALLKRMNRSDLTAHGFRSTFRDWAAERTNYPREVAEMALAHAISDKVEAAYRRGDLMEKRRRLMAEWAKHCHAPAAAGAVVQLNRSSRKHSGDPE